MKKSILVIAILSFFSVATFAQEERDLQKQQKQTETHEYNHDMDKKDKDFEDVAVDNVPEAVQRAALQGNMNASIESAKEKVLENGEKVYKVKLSGVEMGEETKTFYANGTEYEWEKEDGKKEYRAR